MPAGKKYGGRKKGTPNKFSSSVKSTLEDAFNQLGGVEAFVRWGKKHRTNFYLIWCKMLPKEMSVALDLDDTLGGKVREKLNEVDGESGGQPSEAGGVDTSDVGNSPALATDKSEAPADGSGQVG